MRAQNKTEILLKGEIMMITSSETKFEILTPKIV